MKLFDNYWVVWYIYIYIVVRTTFKFLLVCIRSRLWVRATSCVSCGLCCIRHKFVHLTVLYLAQVEGNKGAWFDFQITRCFFLLILLHKQQDCVTGEHYMCGHSFVLNEYRLHLLSHSSDCCIIQPVLNSFSIYVCASRPLSSYRAQCAFIVAYLFTQREPTVKCYSPNDVCREAETLCSAA